MRQIVLALLCVCVCLFIASGVIYAVWPGVDQLNHLGLGLVQASDPTTVFSELGDLPAHPELSELFLRPSSLLFWALQILIWICAALYLLRTMGLISRTPLAAEPSPHRPGDEDDLLLDWIEAEDSQAAAHHPTPRLVFPTAPPPVQAPAPAKQSPDQSPAQQALLSEQASLRTHSGSAAPLREIIALSVGLLAAAVWPWIFAGHPIRGFVLAAIMLAMILGAAMARCSFALPYRSSTSLGVLAGWATLVTCAAFASLLERHLGISSTLSALVALMICAIAAANIQLHLGSPFGFSVTVIWGLLGLVIATMGSDATIATAAALSITFVGFAVVRVTT